MSNILDNNKVQFFYQTEVNLRDRTRLKAFINEIVSRETKLIDAITFIFCTDNELLTINQQYLQHDYYTDIISFELSPKGSPILGEIYISVDRVKDNAITIKETFKREIHRVIFHGVLHFCGYKDKTKRDQELMRAKENEYLDLYFA